LRLRRKHIIPRLAGIKPGGEYEVIGPKAVRVGWRFDDGTTLLLLVNFAITAVTLANPAPPRPPLYCTASRPSAGELPPASAAFYLLHPATGAA